MIIMVTWNHRCRNPIVLHICTYVDHIFCSSAVWLNTFDVIWTFWTFILMWEDIIRVVPITQAPVPTNTRRRSAKCLLRAVGVVPSTELDDKWVKELSSASYTGSPLCSELSLRCLLCLYTSSTPGHQRLWCVTWEGVGGLVTAAAIHYSHLPTHYFHNLAQQRCHTLCNTYFHSPRDSWFWLCK